MKLIKTRPIRIKWKQENDDFAPYIKYLDLGDSKIKKEKLKPNTGLKFQLSENKYCQGYLDENFNRNICPKNNLISKGKQCDNCANKDITKGLRQRKTDLSKDHEYFSSKFAVYLASFGEKVKVGICGKKRYPERCIEQGANKSLKIKTVENVDQAHRIERKISKNTSLTEFLSKKQKLQIKSSKPRLQQHKKNIEIKTGLKLEKNKVENHLITFNLDKDQVKRKYDFLDTQNPVNSEIKFIKGQYIYLKSNQAYNIKYHSGRELQKTRQKQVKDY